MALDLYSGIPERRIGWSSGKAAGKSLSGFLFCAMEGTAANLFSSHLASTVSGY